MLTTLLVAVSMVPQMPTPDLDGYWVGRIETARGKKSQMPKTAKSGKFELWIKDDYTFKGKFKSSDTLGTVNGLWSFNNQTIELFASMVDGKTQVDNRGLRLILSGDGKVMSQRVSDTDSMIFRKMR